MNPITRASLLDAQRHLIAGRHRMALDALRYALQNMTPGIGQQRAWSKIMLAIRATKVAIMLQRESEGNATS